MTRKKITAILFVLLFLVATTPISALESTDIVANDYVADHIIIQYVSQLPDAAINRLEDELQLTLERKLGRQGLGLYKIKKNQDLFKTIEKLNRHKDIAFAELDYKLYPIEATPYIFPNDYYNLLWGLENNNDIDIDAPEAWTMSKGTTDVIVAVIDTGIQITHKDLAGQFVAGYDFFENNTSVYDGTFDDHGTHVSGTIAAIENNGGVVGVAPHIKIMPLKFLGPDGGSTSDAIDAIYYAKANGADIINASWGGGGYSQALKTAIEEFGGPFVAAAGNSHQNTDRVAHYPSAYNSTNIISVAAVDQKGRLPRFSNYGLTTVDVGAPGVDIASTYPNATEDGFAYMSGTSMAAPHVSATLALMLSVDPSLTTSELIDVLYQTVEPLSSLADRTVTGGMINANNALLAISTPVVDTQPPLVIASDPIDGSTDIAIDKQLTITFSESVLPAINYDNITLDGSLPVAITPSINGQTLTLVADSNLDYLSSYTVTIPAGAVADGAGNLLEVPYAFTFTTADAPPITKDIVNVVSSVSPKDKARNVPIESLITINFNQEVILNPNHLIALIDKNGQAVPITIDFTGTSMTLTPQALLIKNMRYTIRCYEGALETQTGDLSQDFISVFTTIRK